MIYKQSMSLALLIRRGVGLWFGVIMLLGPANGQSFPALALFALNTQDPAPKVEPLEFKKPVERKLSGGETHVYQVSLSANQFLRVLVEQRGVDVGLIIFNPEGAKVREVDYRHGERGPEHASLIAKGAGNYRIEVQAVRKTALPGSYQISMEEMRPADDQARSIDAAEELVAEANILRTTSTRESLAQAIAKYRQALAQSEAASDLRAKAIEIGRA